MLLIGELMEEISRHPPAIPARKLLIEHYIAVGWVDAALDNARELRSLAPKDIDVARFIQILEKKPEPPVPDTSTSSPRQKSAGQAIADALVWDVKLGRYTKKPAVSPAEKKQPTAIDIGDNIDAARKDLVAGYEALRARAGFIITDLIHLQTLQRKESMAPSSHTPRIQRIIEGQIEMSTHLHNPRKTARNMRDSPKDAADIVLADMDEAIKWHKKNLEKTSIAVTDKLRDALVKRKAALEIALPDELKIHCEVALMHMEHEHLNRNYTNTETMYGDAVKDIPRSNFYVTEDNYAWDMEELVAAIKAGSGVPRNPLSKQMFTPNDVKGIYVHPLAKSLAALAVEQKEMSKGVRPETITHMEKLSNVLLEDQSADTVPSRHAVDEFLAYIATCKLSHTFAQRLY